VFSAGQVIHSLISICKILFLQGATLAKQEIRILAEWQERRNTPRYCLMAVCKALEYSLWLSSNYRRRFNWISFVFNWISFVRRGLWLFQFHCSEGRIHEARYVCVCVCVCVCMGGGAHFLTWRNGLLRQLSIYWIYHRTKQWCRQLYDGALLHEIFPYFFESFNLVLKEPHNSFQWKECFFKN